MQWHSVRVCRAGPQRLRGSPPIGFRCLCVVCSREFGHKIKTISASEFKESEVEAIKNGGNDVRSGASDGSRKGASANVLMGFVVVMCRWRARFGWRSGHRRSLPHRNRHSPIACASSCVCLERERGRARVKPDSDGLSCVCWRQVRSM
jgi:hypothetical protein